MAQRRRKRYLDNTAPADNTANVVRPVNRMIQVKRQDTPARREKETREYQARVEQGQRIMNTFARTPAGRRAANRAYAIESQKAKQAAAKEEAAAVVGSLFKPLMPSTYVDMAAAIKNGQVNSLTDALAAPYLTNSWSMRNPGKALVTDIVAPFALNKGIQLAKFAGRDIANSWRDMRYALAHPESQTYGIVANSPYSIETLPGYHIGSLQRGNVLEKQLSKAGTVSLKSIQGVINNPNTPKVDKYILKQLVNNHNGEKVIDYNTLRREAQEFIPKYTRVPQNEYAEYGASELGLKHVDDDVSYLIANIPDSHWDNLKDFSVNSANIPYFGKEIASDMAKREYISNHPEIVDKFRHIIPKPPQYNTFSFESPGFSGNNLHYSGKPIGHSRTYITEDESNILHVMESQSDWAQHHKGYRDWLTQDEVDSHLGNVVKRYFGKRYPEDVKKYITELEGGKDFDMTNFSEGFINDATALEDKIQTIPSKEVIKRAINRSGIFATEKRMVDTYLQRQLQENMLYGAEQGKSLMRYPTPETAAKIEMYPKDTLTPEFKEALDAYVEAAGKANKFKFGLSAVPVPKDIENKLEELRRLGKEFTYAPEHQTILRKYSEFPKMFGKLFKGQQVRNVTDKLGNTWYEVDIPSDMLQRELKFKLGGRVRSLKRV